MMPKLWIVFSLMAFSWVRLHKKTINQPIVDVMFINAQWAWPKKENTLCRVKLELGLRKKNTLKLIMEFLLLLWFCHTVVLV
jgi:hypothetical protein